MGILNVTPDSFSDGGEYLSVDNALQQAEKMIAEGADIIDVGGESTRPGSKPVATDEEIRRTIPVIEEIITRFDLPISIDTTKSETAKAAIDAGAEIINDISGLRFDVSVADVAARSNAGLVLMHSRGTFETTHTQPPVDNIIFEVAADFRRAIDLAKTHDVRVEQIALDIGLGFGKTFEQNLELLAKLDKIIAEFQAYPMVVGASRKSFIGKILGDVPPNERLDGSIAAALTAIRNGAKIVRVHDVKETVAAIKHAQLQQ
ncbi:MAG: dihydropteroate synthase [Pyrinomonadaceae bacterium]